MSKSRSTAAEVDHVGDFRDSWTIMLSAPFSKRPRRALSAAAISARVGSRMKTGTDSVRERPPWRPAFGSALGRNADDTEAFRDFYVANVQRVVVFFTRRTLNAEVALDLTGE